jgi:hypothetical protein
VTNEETVTVRIGFNGDPMTAPDRPPLNGWKLIAALPHETMVRKRWMVVVERPDGREWVSAWVKALTDPTWDTGDYHRDMGGAIESALSRCGYDVEPITVH